MASAGLDGGVVITGGQSDFQYSSEKTVPGPQGQYNDLLTEDFINHDPHVPIYPDISSNSIGTEPFQFVVYTTMYVPTDDVSKPVWNIMGNSGVDDSGHPSTFAATALTAVNLQDNPSRVLYQYGGLAPSAKKASAFLQYLV